MVNILLAALFGVLEGVTEWLPVSSTGHLILLRQFVDFPVRDAFFELFEVVIQLAAIGAVVLLFAYRLNPFSRQKTARERRDTWRLWGCVAIAALPSALVGVLFDDLLDRYLYRATVVAATLILYGVVFLVLEKARKREPITLDTAHITGRQSFFVGAFQVLALVPGTSRSGATLLGGMLVGLARPVAAEFSFFLGIPTMCGASALKCVKFALEGNILAGEERAMLVAGSLTAFVCSLMTIRVLLDFVRRHTFAVFGVYRILLGAAVLCTLIL